ncbi:MAG TPA: ribosome recycling factor [Patescibacteria group bacterium]|nr:ribosome recycling factor [Patescibacteria group bacterium]
MIDAIISQSKEDFDKAIEHFEHEMNSLRTGRANAAILSTVMVESYGANMPLHTVANISVGDARTLVISPWDKGQIPAIEKGIMAANLGLTPSNDGQVVRITLPIMSEERRKELVKVLGQISEKARISIRNAREDVLKKFKATEADGGISKDQLSGGQKKLQDVVDKYNAQIKELAEAKEKEIMTI